MTNICTICNKKFKAYGKRKLTAKFCSTKCKGQSMTGKVGHWAGKKRTYKNPEARAEKISETMKGKRPVHLDYQKGVNHPCWIDGRSGTKEYKSYWDKKRKVEKRKNGGSHNFGDWEILKAQYNWTCPCCGKSEPEIKLTEDHIIPLSKGGSNNIENIQPLCHSCNSRKQTKTIKYENTF